MGLILIDADEYVATSHWKKSLSRSILIDNIGYHEIVNILGEPNIMDADAFSQYRWFFRFRNYPIKCFIHTHIQKPGGHILLNRMWLFLFSGHHEFIEKQSEQVYNKIRGLFEVAII